MVLVFSYGFYGGLEPKQSGYVNKHPSHRASAVDLDVFQAPLTPCKAALTPAVSGPWRGNRRAPVQGLLRARSRRHMGSSLASTFKQRH
jgi:hypothetical protein